ncbi:MAG TPA: hypothetical protein VGB82_05335 [Alphaproteobacteria bacterium]
MALAPLEVLIYALVITGQPVPAECNLRPDKTVACSNGVTAAATGTGVGMVLNGTVSIQPARDGSLLFSNGITASRGSAGWIRFSTGIAARRDTSGYRNSFLVAPDLVCTEESETKASCKKRPE